MDKTLKVARELAEQMEQFMRVYKHDSDFDVDGAALLISERLEPLVGAAEEVCAFMPPDNMATPRVKRLRAELERVK